MMKRIVNSWLLLGLMALVMACQGNKGSEAAQQKDGLYGAEARVQSLAPEEKAAV